MSAPTFALTGNRVLDLFESQRRASISAVEDARGFLMGIERLVFDFSRAEVEQARLTLIRFVRENS